MFNHVSQDRLLLHRVSLLVQDGVPTVILRLVSPPEVGPVLLRDALHQRVVLVAPEQHAQSYSQANMSAF